MRGKKWKKGIIAILVLILLTAYAIRLRALKASYSGYGTEYYQLGEEVKEMGLVFRVTGLTVFTPEEWEEKYGTIQTQFRDFFFRSEQFFYMVDLEVENPTENQITYEVYDVFLQSETFGTQNNALLNAQVGSAVDILRLEGGESISLKKVYSLSEATFGARWEEFKAEPKYLTFHRDHNKRMVLLP